MAWKYGFFSDKDFACKCGCGVGTDIMDIDRDLLILLNKVRKEYGPMPSNSGARCQEHNAKVSNTENSAHVTIPGVLQCRAFDCRCSNSSDRDRLIPLTYKYFKRRGLHRAFIHMDVAVAEEYQQNVTWFY